MIVKYSHEYMHEAAGNAGENFAEEIKVVMCKFKSYAEFQANFMSTPYALASSQGPDVEFDEKFTAWKTSERLPLRSPTFSTAFSTAS